MKTIQFGIILAIFTAGSSAQAEVVLVGSEKTAHDAEVFPESRFGSPPMRPQVGIQERYALDAIQDLERASAEHGPSRSIASESNKGIVGLPTSPANTKPTTTSTSRTGIQEIAVIVSDTGFFPSAVFVTKDIPVRLFVTNASRKPLCIMMDQYQVRRQVRTQKVEEIEFTPSSAGQFRFYCPVNGMEGTLLVKEVGFQGSRLPATRGEP